MRRGSIEPVRFRTMPERVTNSIATFRMEMPDRFEPDRVHTEILLASVVLPPPTLFEGMLRVLADNLRQKLGVHRARPRQIRFPSSRTDVAVSSVVAARGARSF